MEITTLPYWTTEDLKKAYEAGKAIVENDWHNEEFHIGINCPCGNKPFPYYSFEQWVKQYAKTVKNDN